jgi:spore germination cell wall hydrolase CwlJ-like protein
MRLVPDRVWAGLTIAQEASNQDYPVKLGVAEVIRDRTRRHWASDGTVPGTVLHAYQFSGWNTKDPNRIRVAGADDNDPVIADCLRAWDEALLNTTATVLGAVMYHDTSVTPDWIPNFIRTCQVGAMIFYATKPPPTAL